MGQNAEDSAKSERKGHKNRPGKQWTKRSVAAERYEAQLDEIHKQYIDEYDGDGIASLRTYSAALTAVVEELTPDELEECQETADSWNKEPVPKAIQQK